MCPLNLCLGLPINPLPPPKARDPRFPHAPIRNHNLSEDGCKLAVRNALRYFPPNTHSVLAPEFMAELKEYGHIYMYRFIPDIEMKAYPIDSYPVKCKEAAAIMLMIMNNLDPNVAQFPHELITYGGNGQVFSNWAQFWIVMHCLSKMTREQTLVMYSGHPLGLFPSNALSPRMVISNGMVIPNYSSRDDYDRMFALGVTMYGQMTAGSYCYIGPQGIVHGTTITLLNAGRKYLRTNDLRGKVFVSSGLGGMSGAQAKAAVISGCVGVIAEVSGDALQKRYRQGWVSEIIDDIDMLIKRIREAKAKKEITSIGFYGNVVTVWERLVKEYEQSKELLVDLGSDQTSCHNPFNGGYYPVDLSYDESQNLMKDDQSKFITLVKISLKRHAIAINTLAEAGMAFWDYGNAFLLEAYRAGANVGAQHTEQGLNFKYPSYVQHIMGDIFSMGFGPFRWVCTSCDSNDLHETDAIACSVFEKILTRKNLPEYVRNQYNDNLKWIQNADEHKLVVGSKARILYSDQEGRIALATAFNEAIAKGKIKAPIVISRDHHDVSGTDSPFRETSNIYDGSAFTADMAIQNCIGDAFRGATWVAIHNGGGVGWGEVINGGFGLVLDGSNEANEKAVNMLSWDVSNGVSRRAWAGNFYAKETIARTMETNSLLCVTMPYEVDTNII
ncbi:urocanate hydratase-like isoform X1 [Dinothrombium tinctorium]|uniref:Urocanate hydratase n=1 Tax=Dinothrombium tinctorium TaxID=1965070 RepID=A0A3S4QGW7_9ACAR|nr:urocanate hydratase-like isoform X1 [Dinothrombium tinctorium]RWS03358.1 urocanate hydratase-like isoform X1 [Dinothrombium tinctorium]RWS07232.1 urocanate hydratase-like isoform X1 [Dinothrombium tinctorium]